MGDEESCRTCVLGCECAGAAVLPPIANGRRPTVAAPTSEIGCLVGDQRGMCFSTFAVGASVRINRTPVLS